MPDEIINDGGSGDAIEDGGITKDGIEDLLNAEDDDTEEGKEDEKPLDIKAADDDDDDDDDSDDEDDTEEDDEEEKIELKEEDDEDSPDDEDLEDIITPSRRRDILKKYPKIFDDFPHLEKAYYREQKFTELFGTVADAEAAKDRASAVDEIEAKILEGDIRPVLKGLKDEDPDVFKKVADDYMQTLADVDQDAYFHVTGNVIKRTVLAMVQQAEKLTDDDGKQLKGAAHLVHQFIFGPGAEWSPPKNLFEGKSGESDEKRQLDQERQQFQQERFETAREGLSGRLERTLKATIDENIDPRGQMTDYVKGHATSEALQALVEAIESDDRFTTLYDKLWQQALEAGYSDRAMKKLRSAYTSKAKTLLPRVIKKSRRNALQGQGQRSRPKRGSTERQGRVSSKRSSHERSDDGRGMSTLDFLNQD